MDATVFLDTLYLLESISCSSSIVVFFTLMKIHSIALRYPLESTSRNFSNLDFTLARMDTIITTSTDVVNNVSYSSIYRFVNLFVLMKMDIKAPVLQAILLCFKFIYAYKYVPSIIYRFLSSILTVCTLGVFLNCPTWKRDYYIFIINHFFQ